MIGNDGGGGKEMVRSSGGSENGAEFKFSFLSLCPLYRSTRCFLGVALEVGVYEYKNLCGAGMKTGNEV